MESCSEQCATAHPDDVTASESRDDAEHRAILAAVEELSQAESSAAASNAQGLRDHGSEAEDDDDNADDDDDIVTGPLDENLVGTRNENEDQDASSEDDNQGGEVGHSELARHTADERARRSQPTHPITRYAKQFFARRDIKEMIKQSDPQSKILNPKTYATEFIVWLFWTESADPADHNDACGKEIIQYLKHIFSGGVLDGAPISKREAEKFQLRATGNNVTRFLKEHFMPHRKR